MTELTASVALHGLSLAVTGKVVRTTALVTGSGTRATSEAATATVSTDKSASADGSTATHVTVDRIGAGALQEVSVHVLSMVC